MRRRVDHIKNQLIVRLREQLESVTRRLFAEEGRNRSAGNDLRQVLGSYRSLELTDQAELQLQELLFKSPLKEILRSSKELVSPTYPPEHSASVFLKMNNEALSLLHEIGAKFQDLQINLTANSFWPVYVCLVLEIPEIFNYAHTDRFQKMYLVAMQFVRALEESLNEDQRGILHKSAPYAAFMSKWNLPTYYRIRYQETCNNLDACSSGLLELATKPNSSDLRLALSQTLHQELIKIWQEDGIFLNPLRHRFLKLTLELLRSYLTLAKDESLKDPKTIFSERQARPAERPESVQNLDQGLALINDLVLFGTGDILLCVELKLPETKTVSQALKEEFSQTADALLMQQSNVLVHECTILLRQMSDIPRQYRRTNREHPTASSPYVACLVSVFDRLAKAAELPSKNVVVRPQLEKLISVCLDAVIGKFHAQLVEVLTGIRKAGDSLRKLREARIGASSSSDNKPSSNSDEDKMHHQLLIDAGDFTTKILATFPEQKARLGSSLDQLSHLIQHDK
ncbi:Conserved oligomeric Golgi complex subunit 2 [Cichlidogyrus casuarinus]|uniref:Conserved oligomeric Golgi complex subunit 2 n=1 Tax=Cichlidogyrus casuarinus TaxID=1844966 RepID=A0ABD2PWJ0_9PLAT